MGYVKGCNPQPDAVRLPKVRDHSPVNHRQVCPPAIKVDRHGTNGVGQVPEYECPLGVGGLSDADGIVQEAALEGDMAEGHQGGVVIDRVDDGVNIGAYTVGHCRNYVHDRSSAPQSDCSLQDVEVARKVQLVSHDFLAWRSGLERGEH